jgi:hypothetical protein
MSNESNIPGVVRKSFLNPQWTSVGGDDRGPIDVYGAIPAPSSADLLNAYNDTVYSCRSRPDRGVRAGASQGMIWLCGRYLSHPR